MKIKKNDTVLVLTGKDADKVAKVLVAMPKENKVIVEGVQLVSKHVKPRRMGESGGIVKAEAPLYACKVMLVCPKCGEPTRLAHKVLADGTKERVCKNEKCGETF